MNCSTQFRGGQVIASVSKLESELYQNKELLALLERLDIKFKPGRVAALSETDVLRREFVEGVLCLN